jgi:hypothetical protein
MGWAAEDLVFDFRRRYFLISITSRQALEITQPPIQSVSGTLSSRVKRPGREADHSSASSTEVNNGRTMTSLPVGLQGVVLN